MLESVEDFGEERNIGPLGDRTRFTLSQICDAVEKLGTSPMTMHNEGIRRYDNVILKYNLYGNGYVSDDKNSDSTL